jgi:hypothetical protein
MYVPSPRHDLEPDVEVVTQQYLVTIRELTDFSIQNLVGLVCLITAQRSIPYLQIGEDLLDTEPELAEHFPHVDSAEESFRAAEHFREYVEQLFFGGKPNLCDVVFILACDEVAQKPLQFF